MLVSRNISFSKVGGGRQGGVGWAATGDWRAPNNEVIKDALAPLRCLTSLRWQWDTITIIIGPYLLKAHLDGVIFLYKRDQFLPSRISWNFTFAIWQ